MASSHTQLPDSDKTADAQSSILAPISRTPVDQGTSNLDAFIYGQPGSSEPPVGVEVRRDLPKSPKQEDVAYINMDPHIHQSRPHSEAWYHEKEQEIKARGGRKANYGRAAQRMQQKRMQEGPQSLESRLPDRVRHNDNWVSALKWFGSGGRDGSAVQDASGGQDDTVVQAKTITVTTEPPMGVGIPFKKRRRQAYD